MNNRASQYALHGIFVSCSQFDGTYTVCGLFRIAQWSKEFIKQQQPQQQLYFLCVRVCDYSLESMPSTESAFFCIWIIICIRRLFSWNILFNWVHQRRMQAIFGFVVVLIDNKTPLKVNLWCVHDLYGRILRTGWMTNKWTRNLLW